MKKILCFLFIGWFGLATTLMAQQVSQDADPDTIRISLLTCGAGEEIYTLFGHTGIRYERPSQGIDVVFNYGVFDFNTPFFILRFALGETDYQLGVSDFSHFCRVYAYYGRSVWQQTLNLNRDEQLRLIRLLEENYLPEHREYRYNFFFDNCATRPRDMIERAVHNNIRYAREGDEVLADTTYRTLIHQYSQQHAWSRFGMDLCMGSKADRPITRRAREFVPFALQADFRTAQLADSSGTLRPLVIEERLLVPSPHRHETAAETDQPLMLAILLLCGIVLPLTLYGYRICRPFWGLDLLLFGAAGLAGIVLAFLACFSSHPCVDSNWILLVFHPLHLFALPCMLRRVARKLPSRYLMGNAIALTLFIIVFLLKIQIIPLSVVLLALCLLIRSMGNLILALKKKA